VAGDATQPLASFSSDTRTLRPGDTFIALAGPHFDGNTFVTVAVARGARGAVVSDQAAAAAAAAAGLITIQVRDTLEALHLLARHVRQVSGAWVVAITGSAGKTTTKEAAATLLSSKYKTLRNRGNLNNHIGLPLSLLELQEGAELAVVELGMNHPGEIATLVSIAEPDVRVWTNVGSAHLGSFDSVEALAAAKAEILQGATARTVFVANADDPMVRARISGFPGRTITFGVDADADVRAVAVQDRGIDGQEAAIRTPAGSVHLSLQLPGRAHLANVLAAIAVAVHFAVPLPEIASRAPKLTAASHRGEVVPLARGIRVFDDCYNSSPGALLRSLEVIRDTAARGRKVAVLGEMLELGAFAEALHRACGRAVVQAGVTRLVTVGGAPARILAEAAREAGLAAPDVTYVADSEQAAEQIVGIVSEGDLVLVKGSRGVRLERVVERLAQEFA
jgi:UDP-N-acetylmuramoyl-tripeptide--D-alanyl-D-alanine ligase